MRPSPSAPHYDTDRLPRGEASLIIGAFSVLSWIALLGIVYAGLAIF